MTRHPAEVLLERWRSDLAAWAIPGEIRSQVSETPWVLPRQVFARRAERQLRQPFGCSFERAREALQPPGEVLDVGAGAGAACLPLAQLATDITAVDRDEEMLRVLAETAARNGTRVRTVTASWPEAARQAGTADVVTCHHVLYNVADLEPFVAALTRRARRRVVVEVTSRHPLVSLNPLWQRIHGLPRPEGPTAEDVLAILTALGLRVAAEAWTRPATSDYASFADLVEVTRRRLCLPPERAGDLADVMRELGSDPDQPLDLGSSGRHLVTIWWPGSAQR
ncbi:MAG TPA: methyltransferase domain-containing protein [Streptosporangiaceae bacterium]|nr:methyltransferase domain-containing protein [Streptosporangiaceae bacterium]